MHRVWVQRDWLWRPTKAVTTRWTAELGESLRNGWWWEEGLLSCNIEYIKVIISNSGRWHGRMNTALAHDFKDFENKWALVGCWLGNWTIVPVGQCFPSLDNLLKEELCKHVWIGDCAWKTRLQVSPPPPCIFCLHSFSVMMPGLPEFSVGARPSLWSVKLPVV